MIKFTTLFLSRFCPLQALLATGICMVVIFWGIPAEKSFCLSQQNTGIKPYKQIHDDPLTFTGHAEPNASLSNKNPIIIGLFVPDKPDEPAGKAILQGAEMALTIANNKGGYQGRTFKIIQRWSDSPWSGGSNEMINFVYKDKAAAVISYMSASSHIAEQIATKTYIPVITPISSDPSLTHARVPWMFRLPPDDQQQATALINSLTHTIHDKKIGLITATDQDSRMAAIELKKEMIKKGIPPLFHHELDQNISDFKFLGQMLKESVPSALVIRLTKDQFHELFKSLIASNIHCPIFTPWVPGLDIETMKNNYPSKITIIDPLTTQENNTRYKQFSSSYYKLYKKPPLASAAFAFDAVEIIINAILSKGFDRAEIRNEIANLTEYKGVTGSLVWDNGGGNMSKPGIRIIQ